MHSFGMYCIVFLKSVHDPHLNSDPSAFQLHYELSGFLRDVQRRGSACGIPPAHGQLHAVRFAPPDGGAVPRLLRCQPGGAHSVCGGEAGRWVGRCTHTHTHIDAKGWATAALHQISHQNYFLLLTIVTPCPYLLYTSRSFCPFMDRRKVLHSLALLYSTPVIMFGNDSCYVVQLCSMK